MITRKRALVYFHRITPAFGRNQIPGDIDIIDFFERKKISNRFHDVMSQTAATYELQSPESQNPHHN